jgi:di/tricarboxylate transporter
VILADEIECGQIRIHPALQPPGNLNLNTKKHLTRCNLFDELKKDCLCNKAISVACFISIAALIGSLALNSNARADDLDNNSLQTGQEESLHSIPPRGTHYITVQLKLPSRALIAGETGSFELEAFINDTKNSDGISPIWDSSISAPLTVWISTPQESGIAFLDRERPDRPYHHLLVAFAVPEAVGSQSLRKKIEYTVESDTKAGKHSFWLDISANLKTPDGQNIHDMGVSTLPFEVDTHLKTKILMLIVIAIVVSLFILEWVRVDVVAILIMVLLPELGLLNAHDAFRGLSSNAVVAIIGVMIISYGLNRAGIVNRILRPLMGLVSRGSGWLVLIFSSSIAVISSIMQNTGAAVLFLPAIRLVVSHRLKIHISRVLMPIGMAAILGGTLTMIGTSPLILLNDTLPRGMPKFDLLELTPIGLALVIGGIAYLSTFGMRLLAHNASVMADSHSGSDRNIQNEFLSSYPLINGPFEIYVPRDYRASKGPQKIVNIRRRYLVNIVATARDDGTQNIAPPPHSDIRGGFILCAYGPEKNIRDFVSDYGLVLREDSQFFKNTLFDPSIAGIVEGVISPRSEMIGRTIQEIRFRETFGVTALAVNRAGEVYYQELADLPLQSGDTVLVHGTWEQFHTLQDFHQNLIIISPFEEEFQKPEKVKLASICFLIALCLMILSSLYFKKQPYNPIPLSVCLMIGAVGMILCRVMTIGEAYRAVDWRTVFLLGGLIPLGMSVDQTGTAQWIARAVIFSLGKFMSPLLLLLILACLSCCFSMVVSNVGACALLVPLGISLAGEIGIDPRVAAIVVGIGVSNSFLLPTHQVNALYMGPGGYRTKDYIKIGGILSLIYIVILVFMIYFFYL